MPTYRLGSSPLVHAPGFLAWAINAYAFARDRAVILRVVTDTWPGPREDHASLLLSGDLPYRLEDDTVVLDSPETSAAAAPAETDARTISANAREVEQ